MSKNIATAYVRFVQVSGGKRRPIFILQETEDKVFFFDITTKFKNKAEEIKKHYFEIKEYENTGLKKHSWIDTYRRYSVSKNAKNNFMLKQPALKLLYLKLAVFLRVYN